MGYIWHYKQIPRPDAGPHPSSAGRRKEVCNHDTLKCGGSGPAAAAALSCGPVTVGVARASERRVSTWYAIHCFHWACDDLGGKLEPPACRHLTVTVTRDLEHHVHASPHNAGAVQGCGRSESTVAEPTDGSGCMWLGGPGARDQRRRDGAIRHWLV